MKLKYYLRGLGIGILVTIIIVAVSGAGKNTMTDEEIKDRARELGMIESTVLAPSPSTEPEGMETPKPSVEPEATATPKPSVEPEATATPEPSIGPEETATPTPSIEPEETIIPDDNVGTGETVTIVIANGESSVTVSKTLEEAGLVESASDYDRYLCDNGYDKKIRTGTYEIPVGADEEEIALIITRRN